MSRLIHKDSQSESTTNQEQVGQYLTFLIAKESFGVNILDVKEIIEIVNVTRIPLTPEYIHGVINLRGNVVPVIDLSARLKNRITNVNKRCCIVLVEVETADSGQLLGMLVDEVREILEIPRINILPAPDFGTEIHTDFIQAMARIDGDFIILLAMEKVLSLGELAQLNQLTMEKSNFSNTNLIEKNNGDD